MVKIFFVVGITIFISTGLGSFLTKKTSIKQLYSAPLGFAFLLFSLQLFYYPIQLFNLSSYYIHVITTIIYGLLLIYSLLNIKDIFYEYLRWETLWILVFFLVFLTIFYKSSISIPRADGQMYLNYIAQNVDIDKLNDFNLWTGLRGSEFVTIYLFQGYFHFAAFLNVFVNSFSNLLSIGSTIDSIVISMWGLGSIYSLISAMLIVNIVKSFNWKSIWLDNIILFFTLFYTNLYYWKTAFSFYGNTYRSLFMAMFMYFLFLYVKENNKYYLAFASIIFGASIAASSSSLFIGFAILFGFTFYLYLSKNDEAFQYVALIGLPMVLYVLAIVYKDYISLLLPLVLFSVLFYSMLFNTKFQNILKSINSTVSKHAKLIFLVILPLIAIAYSIWDVITHPEYIWSIYHYFNNHANYDMVKDYLFIHSNWMDNLLNVFRWLGLLSLIATRNKQKQINYYLWQSAFVLLFFLNPLTTSFISRMFASNVYYRAFESLFNVFSEILIFGLLLNRFWNIKSLRSLIVVSFVSIVIISNYQSFVLADTGASYGYYINEGKTVLPLYKIKNSELEVIRAFQDEYERLDITSDHQITVVSQVDGLRTFLPDVYQVFTARQYWSTWDRIDQDFYQVARLWYGWEERPEDIDYTKSCSYLVKYNIDYVINEIWENAPFDQAINDCTDVIYENYEFRLRKVTQ